MQKAVPQKVHKEGCLPCKVLVSNCSNITTQLLTPNYPGCTGSSCGDAASD